MDSPIFFVYRLYKYPILYKCFDIYAIIGGLVVKFGFFVVISRCFSEIKV